MILSVLIASMPHRLEGLAALWRSLPDRDEVEVLSLVDRQRALSDKCNQLVSLATGEYCMFLDDDDELAPGYFDRVLPAILEHRPDAVLYDMDYSVDGSHVARVIVEHDHTPRDEPGTLYRLPMKTQCIRREIFVAAPFRSRQGFGSDFYQAKRMWGLLDRVHKIDEVLYFHRKSSATHDCLRWEQRYGKARDEAAGHAGTAAG